MRVTSRADGGVRAAIHLASSPEEPVDAEAIATAIDGPRVPSGVAWSLVVGLLAVTGTTAAYAWRRHLREAVVLP